MANIGLLGGLGDALQVLGGAWSANKKAELADKLEQEREARAEARALAKEERMRKRDENTTAEFKIERDADGVTWRQGYNKFGQRTGERELAPAEDIKNYNFEEQKQKVTLENLIGQGKRAQEAHEASLEYRDASTDAQRARAENYRSPKPRSGGSSRSIDSVDGPVEDSSVALALLDEVKGMVKSEGLTDAEAYDVAIASIRAAQREGKDPIDVFRRTIPGYKARMGKSGTPAKKSGGLNLGN